MYLPRSNKYLEFTYGPHKNRKFKNQYHEQTYVHKFLHATKIKSSVTSSDGAYIFVQKIKKLQKSLK